MNTFVIPRVEVNFGWGFCKFVGNNCIMDNIMTKREQVQLFEDRRVRTVWDDEQEKWYFSIVDVVEC